MLRSLIGFGLILFFLPAAVAQEADDLPGFRTTATAVTTQVKRQANASGQPAQPGYLGVFVEADKEGRVVVADVAPNSPAAKAGVSAGDVVSRLGEEAVKTADQFRSLLLSHSPGDLVKLAVLRGSESKELEATVAAVSRPLSATGGGDR